MNTAILVDSAAYISEEVKERPYIFPLHLTIQFPDESQLLDKSEKETYAIFYEKMLSANDLPRTSQPSPGDIVENYQYLIDKGYDTVFVVTLSQAISGTFDTVQLMGQDFKEQLDIRYINSKIATLPEEIIVQYIASMLEANYDTDTIEQTIGTVIDNVKAWLTVPDLTNLIKGGRLNATVGVIGSALKVKPTLTFNTEGSIVLTEIMRSEKKIRRKFCNNVQNYIESRDNSDVTLVVVGGDNQEGVDKMVAELSDLIAQYTIDLRTSEIGPAIATHTGKGVLGVVVVPKPVVDGKVISAL